MSEGGARVWFVTGCSSGIGRAIAEAALAAGDRVCATARRLADLEGLGDRTSDALLLHDLDLTDGASIERAVQAAAARFGRIDVVVNNAGVGMVGAVEECSDGEVRRLYDTNVFGSLAVVRATLPMLRARGAGHLVFVTSIGALSVAASVAVYNSSKAALDALAEGLALELAPLGIGVTSVMPGLVRTNFRSRGIARAERRIDDYAPVVGRVRSGLEQSYPQAAGDPASVGRFVVETIRAGNAPLRLVIGADATAALERKISALDADLGASRGAAARAGGDEGGLALYDM